jgi:hypothetical protein
LFKNSNLGLFLALLLATGTWFYVQHILIPHQIADAAAHDHPRGNLSDLYPRWLGARELLLHGRDPYSPAITREIQAGYYGRAIDPSRAGDPLDQQAFAYPAYVIFLLAPTVNLPLSDVSRGFFWLLWLASVCSVLLWVRGLRWKASKSTIAVLSLLTLSSIPFIQGVKLEQFSLLIAALLAGCAFLLVNGNFMVAGVLLAVCTIKPQLVLPLAAWLILWAASDWRRRKAFLLGFFLTLGILFGAAEWILPGWIPEFFHAVAAYRQYTHAQSLFDNLTDRRWGLVLGLAISLMAAVICWRLRHDSEESPRFVFAFALVLAVTLATVPTVSTYNQVLLLPGILLLVHYGPQLWKLNRLTKLAWTFAAAALFWPWVAAVGLTIASFILPASRVQEAWALPFYTSLAIPLAVLGLLFQYAFQILPSKHDAALASERR